MDNTNQPNNPNIPNANPGRTYYNPYSGELQSPFSTDIHGNPNTTTASGHRNVRRSDRYSTPNTTVGPPIGDPLLPLLLLLSLLLLTKAVRRLITSVNNAPSKRR